MFKELVRAAEEAGYQSARLDRPDFMTAAHALYRSCGFADVQAYAESELPDGFKAYLVFMERDLRVSTDGQ